MIGKNGVSDTPKRGAEARQIGDLIPPATVGAKKKGRASGGPENAADENSQDLPKLRKKGDFPPGVSGNPSGRPKGAANKVTRSLKEAILLATEDAGRKLAGDDLEDGQGMRAYFTHMAITQPASFLPLVGRIIPLQVDANLNVNVTRVDVQFLQPGEKIISPPIEDDDDGHS